MKASFNTIILLLALVLTGCKSTNVMHCPDLATTSSRHKIYWAKKSTKDVDIKQHPMLVFTQTSVVAEQPTASADNDIHLKIKLPPFITNKLEQKGEMEGMNKLLADYSGNKVSLQRNSKGKIFFKAASLKDVLKLSHNLAKYRPAAPIDDEVAGRVALAGGILGIIGFVFALGPYVGFGSFLISVAAIVLGIIGLGSWRRGWAITGIILGVLAIVIGAALAGAYVLVLHI